MASKQGYGPDLRKYMDKKLDVRLNAGRRVYGTLRGYDQFMNLVLENVFEFEGGNEKGNQTPLGTVMIRGNSIVLWETLDKIT
jgi:small nuclear ribonucleoprotein G